jgi:flavodoxin/ferredoxin
VYKAVIFYFSGTGNTWWVADKIKKLLDSNNINADTVSIEKADAKKADWWIKTADLIFFGWPVYDNGLPEPMKDFINNLKPIVKGKHIHTFCTRMGISGDGARSYYNLFKKKGLIIDSTQRYIMPSNMSHIGGIFGTPKNEARILEIIDNCGEQVERNILKLLVGKAETKEKYSYPPSILFRIPYLLLFKKYKEQAGVDKKRCNSCGLCSLICPSDNIQMNEYPEFAGKCSLCMRCYAMCPEYAITVKGKSRDVNKTGKPYLIHDRRFRQSILKQY